MNRSHMDDMKELIHREIQSIPNLAERVAFKDMMEGVFLALYEKNEEIWIGCSWRCSYNWSVVDLFWRKNKNTPHILK